MSLIGDKPESHNPYEGRTLAYTMLLDDPSGFDGLCVIHFQDIARNVGTQGEIHARHRHDVWCQAFSLPVRTASQMCNDVRDLGKEERRLLTDYMFNVLQLPKKDNEVVGNQVKLLADIVGSTVKVVNPEEMSEAEMTELRKQFTGNQHFAPRWSRTRRSMTSACLMVCRRPGKKGWCGTPRELYSSWKPTVQTTTVSWISNTSPSPFRRPRHYSPSGNARRRSLAT